MGNKKETPNQRMERIERMRREKEEAKEKVSTDKIVQQLTHESGGEPDFAEIARKLKERQDAEKTSALAGAVKYTIYIDEDVSEAFQALCIKRGDQRRYATQALREFVLKKTKELDID